MSNNSKEQYIIDEIGHEFKSYYDGTGAGKFHKVPVGASKSSHLDEWKLLHRFDAPAIKYVQKMFQDLCIPKAFVSILHYDGFVGQAL